MGKIVGQNVPLRILSGIYQSDRLHHAYLFYGEDGVGKFESALNFAKLLFCEQGDGTYCDTCSACVKINEYRHPDVVTVTTDPRHVHARFFYDRACETKAPELVRAFVSNVRNILSRVELGLLPPYETYPASLPKEHMLGSKTDRKRHVALEGHYLAVSKTINKVTPENILRLEDIYLAECGTAEELVKSHGGRKKKGGLPGDFFVALEALFYNITHTTLPIASIRTLIDRIQRKPSQGARRVVIIEGIDKMESTCANIFLHTLEEPPDGNIFVLTTSKIEEIRKDVISPLRSRTMDLRFNTLSRKAVREMCISIFRMSDEDARRIAECATGSAYRALVTALRGGGADDERDEAFLARFVSAVKGSRVDETLSLYNAFTETDEDPEEVLLSLMRAFGSVVREREGDEGKAKNSGLSPELFLDISTESVMIFVEELDALIRQSRRFNLNKRILLVKVLATIHMWLKGHGRPS